VNRSESSEREAEATRVGRIYARYGASRRRRRAWAAGNPGNVAMRDELLAAVLEEAGPELRSGGEVLDVGCGTGFWLEALRDSGVDAGRLTGVDILDERVGAATARIPGATVLSEDARALPFQPGRFSVILMFTLLSSFATTEDVRSAAREAERTLARDGVLVVYEPRLWNPFNPRVRRLRDSDLDDVGLRRDHERTLTLVPPLARRLRSRTASAYPLLARVPALRTHRLLTYRR
jgi:ubiquinone/menaquinone biosynthesis C-methylase UbiE